MTKVEILLDALEASEARRARLEAAARALVDALPRCASDDHTAGAPPATHDEPELGSSPLAGWCDEHAGDSQLSEPYPHAAALRALLVALEPRP